ncbi:CoA transferase [Rhodococcus sp. MS16]|uniref:CaiB/BaiF CoA transferase family protein n=1 Tax=Rhodococcus sp. MS16 TaxID=2579941 RepID=UPI001562168F|nr:CaiB/BaiF CoA-transferase family protein [Rhodococcus sp. MS16]NRI70057.1 CoA transferase [Rhodococcus sp. MS16]
MQTKSNPRGPLNGLRVVELGGIGPGPHGAMMLGDLGADVVRVERPGYGFDADKTDFVLRNRRIVILDLKQESDLQDLHGLVAEADVLIEGFRPGVAERLGFGPEVCIGANPRLIYARMTGWGQSGPLAARAGHDLNYISITGALNAIGRPGERPTVPINLVGDYGGGSMLLVQGVLAALVERSISGRGQEIDVAMVDGVSILVQQILSLHQLGKWNADRGTNMLDGGAPFYDTYECADSKFVAVGALEPQFYRELLQGLQLDTDDLPNRDDVAQWPALRSIFAARFRQQSRDEWTALFETMDACVSPVLDFDEAEHHGHLTARGTRIEIDGLSQAAPAPRFTRTPAPVPTAPPRQEVAASDVQAEWRADSPS